MGSTLREIEWRPKGTLIPAPDWYVDCHRNALRRISVLLNQDEPFTACLRVKLDRTEAAVASIFLKRRWDAELIQFNIAAGDRFARDDEHRAEHFFYSDVSFPTRSGRRVSVFNVPQTFLDWGYRRLHRPDGDNQALNLSEFAGDPDSAAFIQHCAVNYLVKNFWHNFVHRTVQGISSDNYHEFVGLAREDSDFEADHLANLLLVRTFGLPLKTNGRMGRKTRLRLEALFRRNRCNLVFAERASHRDSDRERMTQEERWNELEWRFCRSVSNAVSTALIARGLATPSVRVFLNGEVKSTVDKEIVKTWRTGEVIVEVAGRRIPTAVAAYIPDDELRAEMRGRKLDARRQSDIGRTRKEREASIVGVVLELYGALIRRDRFLRQSVEATLVALGKRISIPLL